MSWKKIFIILTLLLILAAIPYHFYEPGDFSRWQLLTLLRIESALNVEIEYEEASFFPINRITFSDLTVVDKDDRFELEVDELELYYDISLFISNFFNEDLRFDLPGSLARSISKTRLINPEINLEMPERELLKFDKVDLDDTDPVEYESVWERLPALPVGAGVVIDGGSISYSEGGPSIDINPDIFEMIIEDEKRIKTNFTGDIKFNNLEIEKLIYDDEEWEELLLPEFLITGRLSAFLDDRSWEVDSNIEIPSMGQLNRWADRLTGSFGLKEFELAGNQNVDLSMSGEDNEVTNLLIQGETNLNNTVFQYGEMEEPIELNDLSQKFSYSSEDNNLLIPELEFNIFEDERIKLNGSVNLAETVPDYYFDLETGTKDLYRYLDIAADNDREIRRFKEEMEVLFTGPLPVDINLSGGYQENLWLEGNIDSSDLRPVNTESSYDGSAEFSWQNNEFQLTDVNIDDKITGTGYLIPETEEFSFNLEADQFRIDLINSFTEMENDYITDGRVSAEIFGAGKGFELEDLVLSGQLLSEEININNLSINSPWVNFWLKDGFMEIGPARGNSSAGSFDLAGGVDLLNEELELELIMDDLILEEVSSLAGLDQNITGKSRIFGNIGGSFSEPILDLELWLAEAEFFDVEVSDGHGHLNYNPAEEVLFVENLDFTSQSAEIIAGGQLDFSQVLAGENNLPLIDARLDIEELTYDYINEIFGLALPLNGDVGGTVDLDGRLNAPTVNASARSRNTSLPLGDEVFEFQNSRSDFYWTEGEPFQVIDLRMEEEEASFVIEHGEFSDIFYIDYAFEDYRLSKLDSADFDNIKGNLSASGEAGGNYDNPWAYADLELVNLDYDGYDLGGLSGRAELDDGDLLTDGMSWEPGSGDFNINGKVDNILDEAELDLQVDFADVFLPYYIESFKLDTPSFEYYFSGGLEVTGGIDDWLLAVDVDADSEVSDLGRLNLRGWIGEEYDLSLVGIDLGFDWLCDFLGPDVNIDGDLEMFGTVYGPLEGPEIDLETTIKDFQVNQYSLRQISGRVSGDIQKSLAVEQELVAASGEDIKLNGEVNIPNPENSEFHLRARDFPLNPIAGFFPEINLIDGRLDGEVDFAGSLDKPDLEGQLQLNLEELNFGQPDDLSLDGQLDFAGDQIEINNFIGDYNGGGFELTGLINLIEQDNFWDLELTGDSVPLQYSGSSADIDGELSLSGPLYEPLITGNLNLNNLNAVVPEDFAPEEDVDEDYDPFAGGRFKPEADLQVNIGKNNYFNHENAEILMQRGELRLLYQDELQIDGQLSSNQGTILFYNNRFSLDSARLNFRRRRGFIPDVTVRASTRAENTDVFVRLDGLATDLNLTFASDPEMEEQEIIGLLAGRGGIGGALAGEDLNVFQIAQQEFFRFLSDTFQLEIVGNIQSEIRDAFALDRFEIVTNELGWDQEVSLYIGKNLTDRLYIEGSSRIRADEQETDFSFKYDITDKTVLDGTYYGSGEFSLSIETTIEF